MRARRLAWGALGVAGAVAGAVALLLRLLLLLLSTTERTATKCWRLCCRCRS